MHMLLALAMTFTASHHTGHTHHVHQHRHHQVVVHRPVRITEPAPMVVHAPVRITEPAPTLIAEPVIQHRGGPVITICATPDGGTTETC